MRYAKANLHPLPPDIRWPKKTHCVNGHELTPENTIQNFILAVGKMVESVSSANGIIIGVIANAILKLCVEGVVNRKMVSATVEITTAMHNLHLKVGRVLFAVSQV